MWERRCRLQTRSQGLRALLFLSWDSLSSGVLFACSCNKLSVLMSLFFFLLLLLALSGALLGTLALRDSFPLASQRAGVHLNGHRTIQGNPLPGCMRDLSCL